MIENTTAPGRIVRGCEYCGSIHDGVICHKVKAIEYFPNGATKRVEFHPPVQPMWPYNVPVFGDLTIT